MEPEWLRDFKRVSWLPLGAMFILGIIALIINYQLDPPLKGLWRWLAWALVAVPMFIFVLTGPGGFALDQIPMVQSRRKEDILRAINQNKRKKSNDAHSLLRAAIDLPAKFWERLMAHLRRAGPGR